MGMRAWLFVAALLTALSGARGQELILLPSGFREFYTGEGRKPTYLLLDENQDEVTPDAVYVRAYNGLRPAGLEWVAYDSFSPLVDATNVTCEIMVEKAGYSSVTSFPVVCEIRRRIIALQAADGAWEDDGYEHRTGKWFESEDVEREISKSKWGTERRYGIDDILPGSIGFAPGDGIATAAMTPGSFVVGHMSTPNEIDPSQLTFLPGTRMSNYYLYLLPGVLRGTRASVVERITPTGLDVRGWTGLASSPFLSLTADNFIYGRRTMPAPWHLKLPYKYGPSGKPVESFTNAVAFMHMCVGDPKVIYRFRSAENVVSGWKTNENHRLFVNQQEPIENPVEPCDVELYMDVQDRFPYYQFVDYSGLLELHTNLMYRCADGVLRTPAEWSRYVEEADMFHTSYEPTLPFRESMTTQKTWARFRPYTSNIGRCFAILYSNDMEHAWTSSIPASYLTSRPLGYKITSVRRNSFQVSVDFVTDRPPPYCVAVYRAFELGLGRTRAIAHVVTPTNSATVPCNTLDYVSFVQVGDVASLNVTNHVSDSDMRSYREWIGTLPRQVEEGTHERFDGGRFVQVGDYRWNAYFDSATNVFTQEVVGDYYTAIQVTNDDCITMIVNDTVRHELNTAYIDRVTTEWRPQNVSFAGPTTQILPPEILDVGTGYRVMLDERDRAVDVCRAYSAREDRSDEYMLPRAFVPLSVNTNHFKLDQDWLGTPYMQRTLYGDPWKIYLDGVK